MSVDVFDSEPADIWQETRVRAAKDHQCSACNETIRRTDLYVLHKIEDLDINPNDNNQHDI